MPGRMAGACGRGLSNASGCLPGMFGVLPEGVLHCGDV